MSNHTLDVHQLEFCLYECAVVDLVKRINRFNVISKDIIGYEPIDSVKYRIKSAESIVNKLKLKDLTISYESIINNIHDIAGIRITCSFVDNIYDILKYIEGLSDFIIIKVKDYVKNPKRSGYRSLHVILLSKQDFVSNENNIYIELQIRTIAMDFWATLEHKLIYKSFNYNDNHNVNEELRYYSRVISSLDNNINDLKEK